MMPQIQPVDTGVPNPQPPAGPQAGIGVGEAQVLPQGLTSMDGLQYALGEKRRKEAEAAAKRKEHQKVVEDLYQKINELDVSGDVKAIDELNGMKKNLLSAVTEKIMANKDYEPNNDTELLKRVADYKAAYGAAQAHNAWEKTLPATFDKDKMTPESQKEVRDFLNLPSIAAKTAYYSANKGFPSFKPKPEYIDFNEAISKEKAGTIQGKTETRNPDGTTFYTESTSIDAPALEKTAKQFVDAGDITITERPNPKAVALWQYADEMLTKESPEIYPYLPEEEKYKKKKEFATQYYIDRKSSEAKSGSGSGVGGTAPKKPGEWTHGGGNSVSNNMITVTRDEVPGGYKYDFDITNQTDTPTLTFNVTTEDPDTKEKITEAIDGKPQAIIVDKKDPSNSVLTISDKDGEIYKIPYADYKNKLKAKYNLDTETIDAVMGGKPTVTQKAPGKQTTKTKFDYSKAGVEAKAKEMGITPDELKKKILAKRPDATFE